MSGGDEENRTPDPLLARQVLSQLSYTPKFLLILLRLQLNIHMYCLRLVSSSEHKLLLFKLASSFGFFLRLWSVSPYRLCFLQLPVKFVQIGCFELAPRTYGTQANDNTQDTQILVGLSGLEPPTSRLSGVRSNRLSYRPMQGKWVLSSLVSHFFFNINLWMFIFIRFPLLSIAHSKINSTQSWSTLGIWQVFLNLSFLLRKEVIQPHLPIRLPCYDFTPIINPTFDCCLLAVSSQASGVIDSHGVTGGVYKARERIHRDILIRDY